MGRCTVWMRLRPSFRLNDPASPLEWPLVTRSFLDTNVNVHRYEENINGRAYLIEVSSVGAGQWRAQIKRTPGGSGAMMPFYGETPDEAAEHLSKWLSIANGRPRAEV
jgi:hypothetical protein